MHSRWLVIVLFVFSAPIFAEQDKPATNAANAYIADNLFIFMHTGPGRNYRILGSIEAGLPVTVLQRDNENEFTQITDQDGRTGWVESQYLMTQMSRRVEMPLVNQKINDVEQQLQQVTSQNSTIRSQLDQAQQQISDLSTELEQAKSNNVKLQKALDDVDTDRLFKWLSYGGMIAGGGVLLGILLTFIPKRRRRNDTWM
jgi:SH3 domain protein